MFHSGVLACAILLHASPLFAQEPSSPQSIRTFSSIADFKKEAATVKTNFLARVRGTVTFQFGRSSIFIQDGTGGLFCGATNVQPVNVTDRVEVVGQSSYAGFSPTLSSSEIRWIGRTNEPVPAVVTGLSALHEMHDGRLIRIKGRLLEITGRSGLVLIRLLDDAIPFHAELEADSVPAEWLAWAPQSLLQVTGPISIAADGSRQPRSFRLLLRTAADVHRLEPPPWWTFKRTLQVVTGLGVLVLGILIWVAALNHQVRQQTRLLRERLQREEALKSERQKAEAEVARLNQSLERRVEERTAQLEAANKELEAFSYSVSHDLRAPLRAIDGFAQILMDEFAEVTNPEARELVLGMQKNARKMSQLIDDLLAFSRLTRSPLDKAPLRMHELFKSVFEELRLNMKAFNVEFILHPLPLACGDAPSMRQVAVNLLSNAIKYSRKVEKPRIEVGSETRDGQTVFFVKDNGVGFDMKYSSKLFGVFQRLHSDRDFEGTGVGLAIVQRIIHRHGGKVWSEAKPHHGATFYFTLEGPEPAASQPPPAPAP